MLSAERHTIKSSIRNNPNKRTKRQTCKICNKTLASPSSYYVHMKQHSDNKPYSCTRCLATFCRKPYLEVTLKLISFLNSASIPDFAGAYESSYRRTTVRMWHLQETLHSKIQFKHAQTQSFRFEAVLLSTLYEDVYREKLSDSAQVGAHIGFGDCVQRLRSDFY